MWYLRAKDHFICKTMELVKISRCTMNSSGSSKTLKSIFADSGIPSTLHQELISSEKFSEMEPYKLKILLNIFKDLGFPWKDLKRCNKIMLKCPCSIDNKFKILEEGGFTVKKIDIMFLKKKSIIFRSLASLKYKGYLKSMDVERNILRHSDFPEELYPPSSDATLTFLSVQNEAVKKYLSWKLKLSDEELEERLDTYSAIYFKSLRLIIKTYEMLINDLGFTHDKIVNNFFLLGIHPTDLQSRLEQLHTIGNVPIRSIALKYPKILVRPIEKVVEIMELLKEKNFSEEDIGATPGLFLLGPKTVKRRIALIGGDPFFKTLFHLPRFGSGVICYEKMVKRTKQLKEISPRLPSFYLLYSPETTFNARIERGSEFASGEDVLQFLSKTLEKPKRDVNKALKVVPQWYQAPLTRVQTNLWFLQDSGFSYSQIWNNMTILLYPTDELKKQLYMLETRPEIECCRDSKGKIRPVLVLQLVLYFIEQPFHFTGNGIWKDSSSHYKPQHLEQSPDEPLSQVTSSNKCLIAI